MSRNETLINWREIALTFGLALLIIIWFGACQDEGGVTDPEITANEGPALRAVVNDIFVRVYSNAEGWSQWEAIVDSMGASLPEDQVLVMQFRQGTHISSLAGFSWPELDTCFIMPEHVEGNSAWRVTYGPENLPYPETGRIEFRSYETHVTQAAARQMWYKAERWDEVAGAYVDESPWFAVRWTHTDNPYHFTDEPEDRR